MSGSAVTPLDIIDNPKNQWLDMQPNCTGSVKKHIQAELGASFTYIAMVMPIFLKINCALQLFKFNLLIQVKYCFVIIFRALTSYVPPISGLELRKCF